ncbi:TPA: pentapeptide repeat-containing protein [Campylobacter jejuni]|nr:pentapeptide repeat-containing protein [Campylobacter jejuni]HEH5715095.1 pentapeptide repeat-containing protein [Campylobacter jejuni]
MEDLVSNFLSEKNIDSEITFEKYIMSKTMLNNEKQYSVKDICCFNANNDNFKRHYDENKILEIHLNNMVFEQDLVFDNVKKLSLIINDNVKFNKLFINNCNELYLQFNGRVEVIDKISINDCKFKQISINNHIDGNIEFQKCEFNDFNLYSFPNATIKGAFTFDFCEIKEKANFMNFEFKNKVSFKMSKFKDNTYFNNSVFKDYADFHECKFEKTACFYGVRFEKAPNFSACYFKEPKAINLINIDIDKLDFKSVEQYIKDNYQDENYKNEIKEIQDEKKKFKVRNKYKLRYAKNLKDSFRTIKDILITQNSILETQEWHKLELYAKEKELEIQLGDDNKGVIRNNRKIKKLKIKKLIIKLIGMFSKLQNLGDIYVKICDFVVCFIMIMGKSIFAIIKIFYNVINNIYKIIQIILSCIFYIASIDRILKLRYLKFYRKIKNIGKSMVDFTLWFDCILLQVYRNTSNHHTNFLKILNFTILMISSYAIFGLLFLNNMDFILSFDPMTIATTNYIVLLMLLIIFLDLTRQLYQYGAILLFLICGLFIISIVSFLSPTYIPAFYFLIYFASVLISYLLFICKIKLFIFISRLFAYTCLIGVVILKPQLINPFVGIFSSDKLYESKFEKSLNDLNASAIVNLASILQNDFNLHLKDQNISFTELNSAKALIIANKENLLKLNDANLNITKEVLGEKYTELLKIINQDKITENTIKSTSVLYSIILLLCIFSLQKTARKNSIVPS